MRRGRITNAATSGDVFSLRSAIKRLLLMDMRAFVVSLMGFALLSVLALWPVQAHAEARLALVIGNAKYKTAPLATPGNDAGLVAQTLQIAGFDVTTGADLDRDALHKALRDFVGKVQRAGSDTVVFVYLSGRGLQYAGDNYFVPVDAVVQREADIPIANVRLTDYIQALAATPAKARIFVFDLARRLHFATEGAPFASGLALVNAESGSLYAFNATPGSVAPDEPGPYGVYAEALDEMMRTGARAEQVFADTRLRANQVSDGAVVPWDVSQLQAPVFFFERNTNAPPLPDWASQENQSLNGLPAAQAYALAIERDTLSGYEAFLAAYPRDPLASRIRALLALRREALTWRRALDAGTPQAYWTYMRRYPHGPHFTDARRRLRLLAAPLDPPPRFDPFDFQGLPAPPEDEEAIIDQPVLILDDPGYARLPPLPVSILLARPAEFEHLPPPTAPRAGSLPVPPAIALQFCKPIDKNTGVLTHPVVSQKEGTRTLDVVSKDKPAIPHAQPGRSATNHREQSNPPHVPKARRATRAEKPASRFPARLPARTASRLKPRSPAKIASKHAPPHAPEKPERASKPAPRAKAAHHTANHPSKATGKGKAGTGKHKSPQ